MKRLLYITVLLQAFICFPQNAEIDSLLLDLAYQKQDTSKVNSSIKLIDALIEIGDYQKAFQFVEQTQDLAENLSYNQGLANAYYYRAIIYNNNDDYFNALDSFNKARQQFELAKDAIGLARVNNQIGILEISRGKYNAGLRLSLSAIDIFEKNNMVQDLGEAYQNLGEAYINTQQLDKALEYYLKALEIQKRLQQNDRIKSSNQIIAELYSNRKEYRKAIEYYEATLNIINDSTDLNIMQEVLPKLGSEYLQFNDLDRASRYLLESLRINRRSENIKGLILTLNALALLNLKKGNWRLADSQAEEAYLLFNNDISSKLKLDNYQVQKEIDSTRGNFEDAFRWQSRYFELKQKLDENERERLLNLNNNSNTKLAEQDNAEERTDAINSENETNSEKRQRLIIYLLGAALLVCIILLILSYVKQSKQHKQTAILNQQISSLQKSNEELGVIIEDLEEKNNVKDRLFSIVSHDLKDSISSIKGFIDLLREDSLSREEFYELVPELSENANNASLLLFNLLNWSKSQLQNLEPKPEMFNVQEIFKDKIQLVQQRVEDKRIAIIDESQRDFAYADKSMIEIVIQNLLTNAVKFSRVGDIITISNKDKNGNSLICVEDTGIGISEENLAKLFQKNSFTTIGTKNEKGTGLGLTICKELVELNQGKIWVESTKNVGTKFFVELPKVKPEATA